MIGPSLDLSKVASDYDKPFDMSFRAIIAYEIHYDINILRLDAKIGDVQFAVAVPCSETQKKPTGNPIRSTDDLISPNGGIISCQNIKTPAHALIAALKELVSDLEEHISRKAEIKTIYKPADGKNEWLS